MKKLQTPKTIIIGLFLMSGLIITGYNLLANNGRTAEISENANKEIITAQTYIAAPQTVNSNISLSGTTEPLDQVMVSPKMSGKAVNIYVNEGDEAQAGQILIKLEQDQVLLTSLNNAMANLTNTIASVNQDISMAELAVTTAQINLNNTEINTAENIRNAEIAVEAAEISLTNAKKSFNNTENTGQQTITNAYDSIKNTAYSGLSAINTALTAVGDIIGESPGDITANDNYEEILGVRDLQSLTDTKSLFAQTKKSYTAAKGSYADISADSSFVAIGAMAEDVNNTLNLIKLTLDRTGILLDNTITKSDFSYASLSALKTIIDGHLLAVNAAISGLQANEQAIINAKLSDNNNSDAVRSAYDGAQSGLERAQQALILTQSQAKTQTDGAEKQLASAQSALESAKKRGNLQTDAAQGRLNSAQAQLGNTAIIAPISGLISQIMIESGEMAAAGKPVVKIINMDSIKIELAVTEFDIGKIFTGQEAEIYLAAYPDEKFIGHVYYASSIADPQNKKFPLKIILENKNKRVKAGLVAEVRIIISAEENALIVPQSAIFIEENLEKIYIVENSIVKIKNIKTENINDNKTYPIKFGENSAEQFKGVKISEGLTAGEEIIIEGNYKLEEGERVNIQN